MKPIKTTRRGMTLVELLVVIAIIGLLAVSVSPLFQAGSDRRRFAEAADVVSGHFNAVIARSIGRAAGDGAWLDATVPSTGAVTSLGYTRTRTASGNMTVTLVNTADADVTFAPALPTSPAPSGLIQVAGFPTPYQIKTGSKIEFLPGYSMENSAFPALNPAAAPYKYRATIPPQTRITAAATELRGGFCIDLTCSTIGVYNFPDPTAPIEPLNAAQVAVLFDSTGRVGIVWKHVPAAAPPWQWFQLDAQRPLALLIGETRRVGMPLVTTPTDQDPGPNVQSPDAIWIVIDPESRMVRTIANNAVPVPSVPRAVTPQDIAHAQEFVLQAFRNN